VGIDEEEDDEETQWERNPSEKKRNPIKERKGKKRALWNVNLQLFLFLLLLLSKTFNQETVPNSTLFIDTYKLGMN
jgi:hypothetical protein